ncbi:hypothetical protein [Rhodanobacter sp. A1T4]|uniref:hypothetical protein n=1 Tax=Rhodanobacter sp. A1T4 TaxID=2723087 RepID=UPI0016188527|nr:hypothetical protein [Rhodanobacter sp. A1T4]MBB6249163.1 hypothetical protein [Rhodanobacter sp. A1T4]
MTQPPVVDILFRAILSGDQAALRDLETYRAAECVGLRSVISTDHAGAVALDLGLGATSSIYVTPLFEGPRAFFISRHISVQARLTSGKTTVPLDYSLSFDSNFAEKMRATLNGEKIQQADHDRVIEVLMLKAKNSRVQFDVVPFLYENVRLVRDNENNMRPLNTLIAFRMLDHLNWEAFRNDPSRFDFGVPADTLKASLRPDAEAFLTDLFANQSIVHHEAKSLGIQALLLRFATLWRNQSKRDIGRILHELLQFCVSELGFIPTTELSLIWSGIRNKEVAPFFGPVINPSAKLFKAARGMAWDMTHLRLMEQTARLTQFGSFFIPHFVSIDERWRTLLRLNPVRFMVVDDARNSMLLARTHELTFQEALHECAGETFLGEVNAEKIEARRMAAQSIDVATMQQRVAKEEQAWR